jgi:RNA polymerase sigma-70 factor (ECF subfamily)
MEQQELLPGLFRNEYRKIVSVLCFLFGIKHIELAEDIVSDTFLTATETWSLKGVPDNPTAWLYAVAKNKTKNHLRRTEIFEKKLSPEIKYTSALTEETEIDLSPENISDSQLAMIFAVCNPVISEESQTALALHLLCGFGIQEIADAYLTTKDVIYKRVSRAKDKLKENNVQIQHPGITEISDRLDTVLATLYLLFSEGYYSKSHNSVLRKDLCEEAMRLTMFLIDNSLTNKPKVNALYALMCFHASRFNARTNEDGEMILYDEQDEELWDRDLIEAGIKYLNRASTGSEVSRYHLEAGISFWHTCKEDLPEKWEAILQLYNQLLILEYSPIAALNRTFVLSKVKGKKAAIAEAEKLNLTNNPFYFSLLGNLYSGINNDKALQHYRTASELARTSADKKTISKLIQEIFDQPA